MKITQTYFLFVTIIFVLAFTSSNCSQSSKRSLVTVSARRTDTLYKRCPTLRADFYNNQVNDSQSWARKQTEASLNWNG